MSMSEKNPGSGLTLCDWDNIDFFFLSFCPRFTGQALHPAYGGTGTKKQKSQGQKNGSPAVCGTGACYTGNAPFSIGGASHFLSFWFESNKAEDPVSCFSENMKR